MEILPRRQVEYRGRMLEEMDLDALLARHPQLALVDELAHTNAPGSRHPKRYMDVEELLAAGIDVYTTLNIQHVESLNDVVARITRIRVRETVPDSVIDRADDIELIDLTPEDLIQRLREGKVYVPHQAERAIRHYFSPGNLTALRELALRRTAQRVDEQMVRYMQAHAIKGPWAAGERVLVCVSGDADSAAVVRHARRMADRLQGAMDRAARRDVAQPAHDRGRAELCRRGVAAGDAARRRGGHAARRRRRRDRCRLRARQQRDADRRRAGAAIAVAGHRVRLGGAADHSQGGRRGHRPCHRASRATTRATDAPRPPAEPRTFGLQPQRVAGQPGMRCVAAVLGVPVREMLGIGSISLLFLTAVLVSAVLFGLWPALFACVAQHAGL